MIGPPYRLHYDCAVSRHKRGYARARSEACRAPSLALPKFESYAPLEKTAVCGLKSKFRIEWFHGIGRLALQLPFCFEVRVLSGRLVSSTPERPCDDMCGLDSLSSESDGDAADFLD